MEQRFLKFEDAMEKLGISAERLNELREAGEVRAYRDGSSWKFRGDEIEKLATEGIPQPAPPSDIGLAKPEELVAAEPLSDSSDDLDDDLKLADDDDLSLADSEVGIDAPKPDAAEKPQAKNPAAGGSGDESGIELAEMDDTVTAETSDVSLAPEESSSDSILLSEEELGESVGNPASTIIGKDELAAEDADLELASDDDLEIETGSAPEKPAAAGASDVLSAGVSGSGVLEDDDSDDSTNLRAFEDLDEIEIDLEAESSRILSADEAKQAEALAGDPSGSELELEGADDEGTDPVPVDVAAAEASTPGAGDSGELELELSDSTAGSDIDLDTGGDDFVLAEGSGSDITLGSGDSGINLVSPSDSGVALDDIPLEMGGSAILSSLSLGGGSDPDISLVASDVNMGSQKAQVQEDEDFQLTPLSEAAEDDEGDSSSQVIALDAAAEGELAGSEAGLLGGDAFAEEAGESGLLTEDDQIDDVGLDPSYAGAPVTAARESEFTVGNILALGGCAFLTLLAVLMLSDMIRNIDSWNQPYALNSSLLDAILVKLGLIQG